MLSMVNDVYRSVVDSLIAFLPRQIMHYWKFLRASFKLLRSLQLVLIYSVFE